MSFRERIYIDRESMVDAICRHLHSLHDDDLQETYEQLELGDERLDAYWETDLADDLSNWIEYRDAHR